MRNEDNLFVLIRKADEKAFELLFRLYFEPITNFCIQFVHDADLAKGLSQQVFINVWENRNKLQNQAAKPYLYRAAKNICLNHLRHQEVKNKYQELEKYEISTYIMEEDSFNNELTTIYNTIEKLPAQCKRVFIMSRMHGLSHKEIAEELDIAVKTVKNQTSKALKFLKEELSHMRTYLIICGLYFFDNFL